MQHFLEFFYDRNGTLKAYTKKRSDFRAPRKNKKDGWGCVALHSLYLRTVRSRTLQEIGRASCRERV